MDKLKKNGFWIGCTLMVVACLGVWFWETGKIKKQAEENKKTVESKFSAMRSIEGAQNLPNEGVKAGMKEHYDIVRKDVITAWRKKYEDQGSIFGERPEPQEAEEGTLYGWPRKQLDDRFVDKVIQWQPIEEKVAFPTPDPSVDLRVDRREKYAEYIRTELPKLAERIRSEWTVVSDLDAEKETSSEKPQLAVTWDAANQQQIFENHFNTWSYKAGTTDPAPSVLEILYAQEDLWVLWSLMEVIRATNGEAVNPHQTAIDHIYSIEIGKMAGKSAGVVHRLIGGEEMEGYTAGGGYGDADLHTPETGYGDTDPNAPPDPAEGRYVDENYQPLQASVLRNAATSTDPEDAYLAVAKRMPVRLRVRMDQSKINDFLVECGNSDLTVEIQQVRINREGEGGGRSLPPRSSGGGHGTMHGGGHVPGHVPPPPSGGHGGSGFFGGSGGGTTPSGPVESGADGQDGNVDVEVYGIVYIYNPVAPLKLYPDPSDPPPAVEDEGPGTTPPTPTADPAETPDEATAGDETKSGEESVIEGDTRPKTEKPDAASQE